MSLPIDDLFELIDQTVKHLNNNQSNLALTAASEARGILNATLIKQPQFREAIWKEIRLRYEEGESPSQLAREYPMSSGHIRKKACVELWMNKRRIEKTIKKQTHRNTYFKPCLICHKEFVSSYKSAVHCNVCTAIEKRNMVTRND